MAQRSRSNGLMSRALIHTAAKLHYVEGLSQLEVAQRMQISTATVSRLLARGRAEGIVRIEVVDPDTAAAEDAALAQALGLSRVRGVDGGRLAALSGAVGALIAEAALPRGAVLAIGWGRAVQSVVSGGLPDLPGAQVVPTTGGMNETAAHFQINEFVRHAAEQTGGTPHLLYAPARPGPDLHGQLLRDPQIASIMDLWDRVDVSITGVGNFPDTPGENALGFAPDEAARVAGDVVRQYFDIDGTAIPWPNQSAQMGISRAQLTRIPLSIGVAVGASKAGPIIGAARSGMINTLVTDQATARAILARLGAEAAE